jgi:hypothetical protein
VLAETLHRLASQRATCKLAAVILAVVILVFGVPGKTGAMNLLWTAAPLALLGLAEAGYAAQERRGWQLLARQTGSETPALAPASAGAAIGGTFLSAFSLSIWPFYLSLVGVIVAGVLLAPVKPVKPTVIPNPAAGIPVQPYRQIVPSSSPFIQRGSAEAMAPRSTPRIGTSANGPRVLQPASVPGTPPPARPRSPEGFVPPP